MQQLVPGGRFSVTYRYEYHGAWLGVLCAPNETSCGIMSPHPPAPVPNYQLGGEWAFIGSDGDSQHYGQHTYKDVGVPVGPVVASLTVPHGSITEEVATKTIHIGNFADVWYTIVREATLTFTLPKNLPTGSLYLGLNNHPTGTISIFGGSYRNRTSPYRNGPYEDAAWWTNGTLLDLRNPAVATTYVALGDSYSAGEGLAPYLPGSNTKTNTCHRSKKAYSQLLTTQLLKSFHACSQVKIAAWFGNTEKSHEPAQQGYLDSSTALLTMTLGGNNLDWTKVLSSCTKVEAQVTHRLLLPYRKGTCTKNLEAVSGKITAMVNGGSAVNGVRQSGLLDVYRDALRKAPLAQIRVLGYPPIFPDRGNKKSGCRIARINLTDPVHNIPPTQLVLASDVEDEMVTLQAQANRAIRDAVALVQAEKPDNRRLSFVDIEGPFGGAQGHTISCGDTRRAEPWINAVKLSSAAAAKLVGDLARGKHRFSSDLFSIYSASFHPKERGQQAMAEALAESLRMLGSAT